MWERRSPERVVRSLGRKQKDVCMRSLKQKEVSSSLLESPHPPFISPFSCVFHARLRELPQISKHFHVQNGFTSIGTDEYRLK